MQQHSPREHNQIAWLQGRESACNKWVIFSVCQHLITCKHTRGLSTVETSAAGKELPVGWT